MACCDSSPYLKETGHWASGRPREDCDGDLRHLPPEPQEEVTRITGDET